MDVRDIIAFVALLHLAISVLAVSGVIRDFTISRSQKFAQATIVLLIPVLGPLGMLCYLTAAHTRDDFAKILPFPLYLLR